MQHRRLSGSPRLRRRRGLPATPSPALDFLTRYRLDLLGDVSTKLASDLKMRLAAGIVTGQSVPNLVRDLGTVIDDPETFRVAGNTVFKSAQLRLTTIVRSETNRAHNQGRLKFYGAAGIRQVKWLADDDPCPICRALDGKIYDLDKAPALPAHPNCECTIVAAGESRVCDFSPRATAVRQHTAVRQRPTLFLLRSYADAVGGPAAVTPAPVDSQGACVLAPEQLTALIDQNAGPQALDFSPYKDTIQAGDYGSLPAAVVRALAKKRGLSVHRSKMELVKLLADMDTATAKGVQQAAESVPNFAAMTVPQLQDEAKKLGLPIAKNKAQLIKELEAAEPNPSIPHFALKGQDLEYKVKQHHISKLKSKQQLIDELGAAHGITADAADAAAAALKHKTELVTAIDAVTVPETPAGWKDFLDAYKKAAATVEAKAPLIAKAEHDVLAHGLAAKKAAWDSKLAGMTAMDLKTLAKETRVHHWQWHTKSDFVTKFTSTDADEIAKVNAAVELKWQQWKANLKAPPKPKPVQPAPPADPVVVPETKLPPKDPTKLAAADAGFAEVDAAWERRAAAQRAAATFGQRKSAQELGGAHKKYLYVDRDGERWLFKPVDERFRAHADEVAYKVGRLVDPDAIEARVIKLDGEFGSIQKIRTDLAAKKDLAGQAPWDLTPAELEQVQREHVIDWLLGNHDAHAANFLRGKSGHIYGIDKGQAFKYLGEDKLALDYHPNARFGQSGPYYHTMMRAFAERRIDLDLCTTLTYIRRVEAIADDDYLGLIRPYFEQRFSDAAKREAFLQMALSRKRALRADFERYYDDLARRRGIKEGFRFDNTKPATGRLGEFETKIVDDAAAARWQGKSLPVDEDQIEDQNALVFEQIVRKDGKVAGHQTVVHLKVRPEHEHRIVEAIRPHLKAGARALPQIGEPLAEDEFHDAILAAVKSINHHLADKTPNSDTVNKSLELRERLSALQKHTDPEVRAMADAYLAALDDIKDTYGSMLFGDGAKAPLGKFEAYVRKTAPKAEKKTTKEFRASEVAVRLQRRSNERGEVVWDSTIQTVNQAFGARRLGKGVQYEIDFDDGVTVVYRPWKGNGDVYAIAGEMEVRVSDRLGPEAVEKALSKLERLDLNAATASIEDAEIMYLRKQAYVLGIDDSPRFAAALKQAEGQDKQAQVRALREFWSAELGVTDVTKRPGYDPFGTFQHGTKTDAAAGRRLQMRFDVTEADLHRELPNHALYHNLTNDRDVASFVEEALEHNGAMISTAEKLRTGIQPGGMSPGADMETGGASYFFTRIRKRPTTARSGNAGLYFKKGLLRRMDAITYEGDKFGRTTDSTVRTFRRSDPKRWREIAERGNSDETIFKYTVTLADNIDVIVTRSAQERARVIAAFKKHGHGVLPDGRKIEDVVLSK